METELIGGDAGGACGWRGTHRLSSDSVPGTAGSQLLQDRTPRALSSPHPHCTPSNT